MSLGSNIRLPNIRKFFLPDPGYILFDVDLAGADAQIVAWEAGDEPLKQAFRDHAAGKGPKVHCVNSRAIFGERAGLDGKTDPYYSRAKAGVHLCVADGHEVLTPFGWERVEDVSPQTPILVTEADGTKAHWEIPQSWYHAPYTGEMLSLTGASYDQLVTPNHKMPYFVDSKVRSCEAQQLPRSARLPKAALYSGPKNIDPNQLRLLSAFHADGSVSKKQVRFHLKKERKIDRLCWLLEQLDIQYDLRKYSEGSTNIILLGGSPAADWLILQGKRPTWDMLQYSETNLDAYLEELPYWDGCQSITSQNFSTAIAETAEVIHTLLHVRGHGGTNNKKGERNFVVQINNRPLARLEQRTVVQYSGSVHCPTVSTGFWFTRYKGRCAVTGNTNYGGKAKTCAAALSISVPAAEHFQRTWFELHPAIKEWHHTVENNLRLSRSVSNAFSFVRTYFDRIDDQLLGQALAWGPQSSVAIIIDTAYNRITNDIPEIDILLQVHDSLVGQCPITKWPRLKPLLRQALEVVVPYADPLIVPTGLATSTKSWGDVQNESWDS